jgi:hypothetical protein
VKPNDVSLIPLANLHHQRYMVYWKTMTAAEWDACNVKPTAVSAGNLSVGLAYKVSARVRHGLRTGIGDEGVGGTNNPFPALRSPP